MNRRGQRTQSCRNSTLTLKGFVFMPLIRKQTFDCSYNDLIAANTVERRLSEHYFNKSHQNVTPVSEKHSITNCVSKISATFESKKHLTKCCIS